MERWWPAQYFVSSGIDGERSWRMEGKSSGKNVPMNPLHNLLENLLNTWPVLTVFIDLILGTEKIKDTRTPTGLGNSYQVAPARVPQLHLLPLACSQGVQGNKKWETVKELRFFSAICPSSHRDEDLLPQSEISWNLRRSHVSFLLKLFLLSHFPTCWASCHFPCTGFSSPSASTTGDFIELGFCCAWPSPYGGRA